MTNVLITNTYFYKLDDKQWKIKMPYPPLGTLYAASYLREQGITVQFFDSSLKDNPNSIGATIQKNKPKVFVIYDDGFNYLTKMCLTVMRESAFRMIAIAKEFGCKVIVSSSDSTDHYQLYLDKGADVIIDGEGEISLYETVDAYQNNRSLNSIQGIIFKDNHDYLKQPKRKVLQDLDQLPMPAWDLIDIKPYKDIWKYSGKEFTLNIATTRGCPFKCNWCAKPIYGNRYNTHSPSYIVNHIKYLTETFGVSRFWMCDDIFGLKPNWVQEFNDMLKIDKISISYYIQSRVDLLLKEDTIDALAESGLEEVWVGAESGSQAILDAMDKGTTVEQIYKATKFLKKKNVRTAFFIQFGYLNETKEDIDKTINMIKDLVPDNMGISVSYPLPGTKFYDKVKEDLMLKKNWTDSDDLAMMFKGTYNSEFYKKLYKYTHKEYRKSQSFNSLSRLFSKPMSLSKVDLRQIVLIGYYTVSAFVYKVQLNKMEHKYA